MSIRWKRSLEKLRITLRFGEVVITIDIPPGLALFQRPFAAIRALSVCSFGVTLPPGCPRLSDRHAFPVQQLAGLFSWAERKTVRQWPAPPLGRRSVHRRIHVSALGMPITRHLTGRTSD